MHVSSFEPVLKSKHHGRLNLEGTVRIPSPTVLTGGENEGQRSLGTVTHCPTYHLIAALPIVFHTNGMMEKQPGETLGHSRFSAAHPLPTLFQRDQDLPSSSKHSLSNGSLLKTWGPGRLRTRLLSHQCSGGELGFGARLHGSDSSNPSCATFNGRFPRLSFCLRDMGIIKEPKPEDLSGINDELHAQG